MYPQNYPGYYPPPLPQKDPEASTRRTIKLVFGICAVCFWAIALALPAFSDGTPGILCFIFGWTCIFTNFFAFVAWLGNIPFIIALFLFFFGKARGTFIAALILSSIAVLFSFGAVTISEIATNEAGSMHPVSASYGTFVWMISEILLMCGAIICTARARS